MQMINYEGQMERFVIMTIKDHESMKEVLYKAKGLLGI